jgi:hemolysin III
MSSGADRLTQFADLNCLAIFPSKFGKSAGGGDFASSNLSYTGHVEREVGAIMSTTATKRIQSPREELWNALTHGLGFVLSIAGLVLLIRRAVELDDAAALASFLVFGIALVLMYASSTIYHSIRHQRWRYWLKVIDHCAIFILIAGTYTPFTLLVLGGAWGWSLFGVIWGIALLGVILKLFFTGRFRLVSTLLYLGMGWLALIVIRPIWQTLPLDGFILLTAGGLAYSVGALFYLAEKMPYHHVAWHIFVVGGSLLHFLTVFYFVAPA